jgi:hypothetical protein
MTKIDVLLLRRTWKEFENGVEIGRVTNGAHIEHLKLNLTIFHAVFKLFHICVCNHFENTLIYYRLNDL